MEQPDLAYIDSEGKLFATTAYTMRCSAAKPETRGSESGIRRGHKDRLKQGGGGAVLWKLGAPKGLYKVASVNLHDS